MNRLPHVPPVDKRTLSPRSRELATQIEKVIQEFQRHYPDTPPGDVQEALRTLAGEPEHAPATRRLLALSLAGGVAALVGALVLIGGSGGGVSELPGDALLWVVGSLVVLFGLVAVARRR